MPYTVTSGPDYDDDLTRIWMLASDKAAVSQASNSIDFILKHHPETCVPDADGVRHLTVEPLAVSFTFSPKDCEVRLLQIMYLAPPTSESL